MLLQKYSSNNRLKWPFKSWFGILILLLTTQAYVISADSQLGVSLNNQGFALAGLGQYQQAINLYQQALPHLTFADERTQINRAATWNNLGVAYAHQQRLQDAYQAFTEALALREQYLGSHNAFTLLSRHNLAVVALSANQTTLACQHMQQAYSGRLKTLGLAHADTQLSGRFLKQIPQCAIPH